MQKKILFLTNSHPVPSFRRLWKKATSLSADGYKVRIICPADKMGKKKPRTQKIEGIKVRYFKKIFKRENLASFLLGEISDFMRVGLLTARLAIFRQFRVIHIVNPTDTLSLIGIIYKILGTKFVYEVNESYAVKFKQERMGKRGADYLISKLLEKLEGLALFTCDLAIVPNYKQKRRITKKIKETKNKIVTIEPLPDLKDFYQPFIGKDYKQGKKYMALYAGSLRIERGLVRLIRSIDVIVRKLGRTDILFVLAGAGRDEQKIRKYIQKKGMQENIYLPGWLCQEELLGYLTEADLGIAPEPIHRGKGAPQDSVFEYMAVGIPVVSYSCRLIKDRIGEAGVIVKKYSEVSFAKEIIKIIDNKDRNLIAGAAGKTKVERKFNWFYSEIKLLVAYEQLFPRKITFGREAIAGNKQ